MSPLRRRGCTARIAASADSIGSPFMLRERSRTKTNRAGPRVGSSSRDLLFRPVFADAEVFRAGRPAEAERDRHFDPIDGHALPQRRRRALRPDALRIPGGENLRLDTVRFRRGTEIERKAERRRAQHAGEPSVHADLDAVDGGEGRLDLDHRLSYRRSAVGRRDDPDLRLGEGRQGREEEDQQRTGHGKRNRFVRKSYF